MMSFLLPFLISALMGMGVGGGGLLIVYLTLYLNTPQLIAQGTNLALFIVAGIGSFFIHFKKRTIKLWQVISGILSGAIGSFISSHLLRNIEPKYAKIALGVFLIISGSIALYNAFNKKSNKKF